MGCNAGWMSKLEGEVKTFAEPMLRGQRVHLCPENQIAIAVWASKFAVVLEGTRPQSDERFYTPDACRSLMVAREVPDLTRVEIGQYVTPALYASGFDFKLSSDGEIGGRGLVTTIVLGHLVLQISSLRPVPPFDGRNAEVPVHPGHWENLLLGAWPPSNGPVTWPPSMLFWEPFHGPFSILSLTTRFDSAGPA